MPTPYPGNPVFPASISSPIGSDPDDAASAAVAIQQLSDRTQYLKGAIDSGIGFEFTDAILHGTTTFADGAIVGTVDSIDLEATADIAIKTLAFLILQDGLIVLNAATSEIGIGNFSGAIQLSAPNVTVNGASFLHGAMRLESVYLPAGTDSNVDASNAYEYLCTDPGANRTINLLGVPLKGTRVRFNAQRVTGAFYFQLIVGARFWLLRNAAAHTAAIELVSDGSAWIVDDWAEGGNTMRNG